MGGEDRFSPLTNPRSYGGVFPSLLPILKTLLYYFLMFRWSLVTLHLPQWVVVVPWEWVLQDSIWNNLGIGCVSVQEEGFCHGFADSKAGHLPVPPLAFSCCAANQLKSITEFPSVQGVWQTLAVPPSFSPSESVLCAGQAFCPWSMCGVAIIFFPDFCIIILSPSIIFPQSQKSGVIFEIGSSCAF